MLLAILCAPFAAAFLAAFVHGGDDRPAGDAAFRFGLVLSLVVAVLAAPLLWGVGAPVDAAWFGLPGTEATVHLRLASDGLTAWLVNLVAWLTPVAILGGRTVAAGRMREWLVAVFACAGLMIGALLARDLVVFYLCYEGMLVPMAILIATFGGPERRSAVLWFVLMTVLGGAPMLVGLWYLADQLNTTDLAAMVEALRQIAAMPLAERPLWYDRSADLLFWSFALAFAVKVPLVPLHAWQARTYAEAPGGAAVLLAGAMAKLGIYGFLRFVLPLFPEHCATHAQVFIVLGLIGTVGGAVVALAQDDAKRLLAYASLSHLGLVLVGIFTFQSAAMVGVAVQMVAHGLSAAAMFVLVGAIEDRTRSPYLDDHGGLAARAPLFAVLFVIAALATAGLPGTANFAGEFLLLAGAFRAQPWIAAVAGLAVILGAAYLLILVQRWCYGTVPEGREPASDLRAHEALPVAALLAASIVFGLYSAPIGRSAGAVCDELAKPARAAAAPKIAQADAPTPVTIAALP